MRYLIMFLPILFFNNFEGHRIQQKNSVYSNILEEVKNIDTSKYFISYEVKDNYPVKDYICEALFNENVLIKNNSDCVKNKILKYNILLTPEITNIIECSKNNLSNKNEIHYILSAPFCLSKNIFLILVSVQFKPAENVVKGGNERAFIFEKNDTGWKLKKKIHLIEI